MTLTPKERGRIVADVLFDIHLAQSLVSDMRQPLTLADHHRIIDAVADAELRKRFHV